MNEVPRAAFRKIWRPIPKDEIRNVRVELIQIKKDARNLVEYGLRYGLLSHSRFPTAGWASVGGEVKIQQPALRVENAG